MSITEFPILTVSGEKGDTGVDGKDGTAIIYDNTPAAAISTATTSWETMMTKTGVTDLETDGDKISLVTVFNTTDISTTGKSVRVKISTKVVGDGSGYYFDFKKGINQVKINIILSRVSATRLHLDVEWKSFSTLNTTSKCFTEFITVTNTSSLNFEIQGNSSVAGDIRCEQFSILGQLLEAAGGGTPGTLSFVGDSGTGTVALTSQTFTIAGTTNEIETAASGQTITIGLPSQFAIGTNSVVDADGDNTFFGESVGNSGVGSRNTGEGYKVLYFNVSGNYNTGEGCFALYNNLSGNSNTGVGDLSLYSNRTGGHNATLGDNGLHYNTDGSYNAGVGADVLLYNTNENYNTAIGGLAFTSFVENTGGNKTFDNTDIDISNEQVTVTGHSFGATGTFQSLKYVEGTSVITGLTDGYIYILEVIDANTLEFTPTTDITDAGSGTGHTFTPKVSYTNSTAVGYNAEPTASNQITFGDINITDNVFSGHLTIKNTGNSIFIGESAGLNDDLSTNRNVYIGYKAGKTGVTAQYNVGVGIQALEAVTTGQNNTAVGTYALLKLTNTHGNTAIGNEAMRNSLGGASNVALGFQALYAITTDFNTAIGNLAGAYYGAGTDFNTAPSNSVFIGDNTRAAANTETNQIVIGHEAIGNGSNTATIGDDNVTDLYANENGSATIHTGKVQLSALNIAPSAANDTGTTGEIRYTADYIFVCVSTDNWKRTAMSTW